MPALVILLVIALKLYSICCNLAYSFPLPGVFFLYPELTLSSLFFWLQGSVQWEARFFSKMAVVSYEYGTLAIKVCLFFYFCCRLFFNVFPFPPSTDKWLGDFHVIRCCAPHRYCTYILNIMRQYYNGASVPPATLVMAHQTRKKIRQTQSEI